jgi:xylulokinase
MKRYLGLDIGTTSLKAAVFDEAGKRLGLRKVDYTLDTDSELGYIEFDPENYITMCKTVIDELVAECGEITALSIDTQGETLILTDDNGKPTAPAIVWLDNRATAEAEAITEKFGTKRVYDVTGQPEITAGWPASKLLWVKNNKPEVFAKTKKVFMLLDWVLYRLTGNFVTEPTIQSSTIYYDIHSMCWWDEMLSFIGVDKAVLPKVVKTGEIVGEYKGIKVAAGTLDQIAGTIGVGVTDESLISEMTGTIMAICVMKSEAPEFDPTSIVPCHLHAIPGKYCMILWSATAGMALKWFREQFASDTSFRELDEMAAKIPAGSDGVTMLPYFCGSTIPNYNPDATATFSGINLSHTKAHFARAIMEAVAFMLKLDLDYAGVSPDSSIRITGGGASSPLWAGIKANVTGMKLDTVEESETACLGAAILAMVGDGAYASIEEAAAATVKTKKSYLPTGEDYTAAYERYCALDNLLNKKA